jgi:1-acyl-sn-glycerol-3-phosphate acyltransferase
MIAFRSILFNIAFYINLIGRMIIFTPYYFLADRKEGLVRTEKLGSIQSLAAGKAIVGTTFEIEGLENIPEGGYIFAPKHQSFWDAYGLAAVA